MFSVALSAISTVFLAVSRSSEISWPRRGMAVNTFQFFSSRSVLSDEMHSSASAMQVSAESASPFLRHSTDCLTDALRCLASETVLKVQMKQIKAITARTIAVISRTRPVFLSLLFDFEPFFLAADLFFFALTVLTLPLLKSDSSDITNLPAY